MSGVQGPCAGCGGSATMGANRRSIAAPLHCGTYASAEPAALCAPWVRRPTLMALSSGTPSMPRPRHDVRGGCIPQSLLIPALPSVHTPPLHDMT